MSVARTNDARAEQELQVNIRKATNSDETAPKRKHVRACIVYTWDHRSSQAFWSGIKVQPILADEVQTFKALITVHKVLQEGHPSTLREAQGHRSWIESLVRALPAGGEGVRGYAPLIREYVRLLVAKLSFHAQHPAFASGTFEYEEYVSLRATHDPNEGYETIVDLMILQDKIDQFQKLVFAQFRHVGNNDCRISALVPLVQESNGIYKFVSGMLRAMHSTTSDEEALAPLRDRFDSQFLRLGKFYYECSTVRYLTSLIQIPKLPNDPPSLLAEDDERAPALPTRPRQQAEPAKAPSPPGSGAGPASVSDEPDEISNFWQNEIERQNKDYEEQQQVLQQRQEQHAVAQHQAAAQAQRDFEDQQRRLLEQQQREQDMLMAQQAQWQTQGKLAELERENLNAKAQYDRDQLMLHQYDSRVKAVESDIQLLQSNYGLQIMARDEQIQTMQEQVTMWRSKYEALAKLYSQLRDEHIDLLSKHKSAQLKAAGAQESIARGEKLERELKSKNLELADLIRERDRAVHEKDRLVGSQQADVDRMLRELRLANEKAEGLERVRGNELSTMLVKHNREVAELEAAVSDKLRALEEVRSSVQAAKAGNADMERALRAKEEELEVYKAGMDETLLQLNELKEQQGDDDQALDGQIDGIILAQLDRISEMIDSVLQAAVARVDDGLYELESTLQAGNQNATGPYVLSQTEKASGSAMEFATAFNRHIADGPNSSAAEVIKTMIVLAGAVADVCTNTKGLTRLATDERKGDGLVNGARQAAQSTVKFFRSLLSFRLEGMDATQKTDVVINCNNEVQMQLQKLSKLVEGVGAGAGVGLGRLAGSKGGGGNGDLGEIVEQELGRAADTITQAAQRLAKLKAKPRDGFSTLELQVHDSMLEAATAIMTAVGQLIGEAAAAQQDIVQAGRGSSSSTAFYKKHNRWTEGLISAAKAVAASTKRLIETADGVLSGRNSPEQLIVASNEVTAATAQLVAASRVKAGAMSRSQEALETASKAVGVACRALVRQVQAMIRDRNRDDDDDMVDYSTLGSHEFKVKEMEQQVEILQLENALSAARHRLGEMRKISYQD